MAERSAGRLDPTTRSLLLEQFAVDQLLLGLALTDHFLFDIVVVPTQRMANVVLTLLREELPERRGEALHVRVIRPDPKKASALAPVEASDLFSDVLTPLLQKEASTKPGLMLTWVDASDARTIDHPAWAMFFARLNERRNAMVDVLPGPVVFVLPSHMDQLLAHEAPDLWSVRSGTYRVKLVDMEAHAFEVDPSLHPPIIASQTSPASRQFVLSVGLESDEPARFDDTSRSWVLAQSVTQLLERGALDEASAVAERTLANARAVLEASPTSQEALEQLAQALDKAGDVAEALGDQSSQQIRAEELLVVVERLVGDRPLTPKLAKLRAEARRGLALSVGGPRGLELAKLAVQDAREQLRLDDGPQTTRLLARCLAELAYRDLDTDNYAATIAAASEALALISASENAVKLSSLARNDAANFAYAVRAEAHLASGRHTDALDDSRAAVESSQKVQQQGPRVPQVWGALAEHWGLMAKVYQATGNLERADQSLREANTITHRMMRTWPQSYLAVRRRLRSLQSSVAVAHALGRRDDAHAMLSEASSLAHAVLERQPDDAEMRSMLASLEAAQRQLDAPDTAALPEPST